jgi:urease accessory protein
VQHKVRLAGTALAALAVQAGPALAHHVMDGSMPVTFVQGLLSGLGHPVIGLDHLAAVIAVGCLAAMHRAGPALAIGFVLAMMAGVAAHLGGAGVPGAEILVALTVLALGAALWRREIAAATALALFAAAGLIHGYALGESIYGAEPAPLVAYLIGLAVIQSAIALAALWAARMYVLRAKPAPLRWVGVGVAAVGLVMLAQQVLPAA